MNAWLAATDTPLTLAGFIALASLGIGAFGLAINATSKNTDLRERLTRLETLVEAHIRNGARHEKPS